MQIRKTYNQVKPELLYDELKEFPPKHGALLGETKFDTYSLPDDSSSFISRATLSYKAAGTGKECLRAHLVGSARGETKLLLTSDDACFPEAKVNALMEDLDFIFGSYEVKPEGM